MERWRIRQKLSGRESDNTEQNRCWHQLIQGEKSDWDVRSNCRGAEARRFGERMLEGGKTLNWNFSGKESNCLESGCHDGSVESNVHVREMRNTGIVWGTPKLSALRAKECDWKRDRSDAKGGAWAGRATAPGKTKHSFKKGRHADGLRLKGLDCSVGSRSSLAQKKIVWYQVILLKDNRYDWKNWEQLQGVPKEMKPKFDGNYRASLERKQECEEIDRDACGLEASHWNEFGGVDG